MAIKAEGLANSLHIDQTEEELATLTGLITTATDLVKSSVNYELDDASYEKFPLFDACVSSLATALYYDRTLENGMPKSTKIMIIHLQARLGGK